MKLSVRPLNPQIREALLDVYEEWLRFNRPHHVKTLNFFAIVCMGLLIPFDFLLFGAYGLHYSPFRVASIAFYLAVLGGLHCASRSERAVAPLAMSALLVATPLQFNVLYGYFLVSTHGAFTDIVLAANFLGAFFTTFYLHRFWLEQYTLTLGSIVALLTYAALYPNARSDCLLVVWCYLTSAIAMFFFRREFTLGMLERFKDLGQLMPANIAKFMVAAHSEAAIEDVFRPTQRFAVCLVADWRNYQDLADRLDARDIARLFQSFYDEAFAAIDRCVPEGTYYADWSADELFVVFYSDDSSGEGAILEQALNFAAEMATAMRERVRSVCGFDLVFDIGIACGVGLLGLQGPKQRKKTTITARFAGRAKRLETEAKELRKAANDGNNNPIIAMEEHIGRFAARQGILDVRFMQNAVAASRNIEGLAIKVWQAPATDANNEPGSWDIGADEELQRPA